MWHTHAPTIRRCLASSLHGTLEAVSQPFVSAGQVVAGKYRLDSCLGRGGMGEVWRAEQLVLRAPIAVKFIDPSLATSEEATRRFLREAQAAAALRSVHVVQILDYGVDRGIPFMVMEYLEGQNLADYLGGRHRLSPAETAHILTHVARAVGKAHEAGIVHRDLKPENVFLLPTGDELVAKVLDFGIAKIQGADAMLQGGTRTGAIMGTPYYMSPEQAEGMKTVDHRTDIWAMGVIAFECLIGQRPFDSDTFGGLVLKICMHAIPRPSAVGPVPTGFDEWFARTVNRNVAERFGSAIEAAQALRAVCSVGATAPSGGAALALPQGAPGGAEMRPVMADTAQPVASTRAVMATGDLAATRRGRAGAAVAVAIALATLGAVGVGGVVFLRGAGHHDAGAAPVVPDSQAAPPSAPPPCFTAPCRGGCAPVGCAGGRPDVARWRCACRLGQRRQGRSAAVRTSGARSPHRRPEVASGAHAREGAGGRAADARG